MDICYYAFSHPSPHHLSSFNILIFSKKEKKKYKREEMVGRWVGECKKTYLYLMVYI
jgi:hypothetical protein